MSEEHPIIGVGDLSIGGKQMRDARTSTQLQHRTVGRTSMQRDNVVASIDPQPVDFARIVEPIEMTAVGCKALSDGLHQGLEKVGRHEEPCAMLVAADDDYFAASPVERVG